MSKLKRLYYILRYPLTYLAVRKERKEMEATDGYVYSEETAQLIRNGGWNE